MLMIPDSVFASQTDDWKIALSTSFRCYKDLIKYCELESSEVPLMIDTDFPLRVTRYYASLIEKGNVNDPLLKQVLPVVEENIMVPGYSFDAVGDQQSMPVPGLIHKYHGRVLLTLTGACAIHCRYCFRRHFPYSESNTDLNPKGAVVRYLQQHDDISEVILSGGDPLILSDDKLAQLIQQLNRIPHIQSLRIHSRLLSVLPERITQNLMNILQQFSGQVVFVTHINHANEISENNQNIFKLISQQGHHIFNQSVLLKQVNDNVTALKTLSFKLFESSVIPYYLHRLDKVQGAAHFDLPSEISCQLYRQLEQQLPGYLLPRMVDEISGRLSKTTAHCC